MLRTRQWHSSPIKTSSSAALTMILANLAFAALLSVAAVRWAIRGRRLLAFLAMLATVLLICIYPAAMFSGFDVRTFLTVLPLGGVSWAIAELVSRRPSNQQMAFGDESPATQFTLRSFAFGVTALAIVFGLMSAVVTLNGPRPVVGRFVDLDSIDDGVEGVVIWQNPLADPARRNEIVADPQTVVAEYDGQAVSPRVILLRPGDTLRFCNVGESGCNPSIETSGNPPANFIVAPGESLSLPFKSEEPLPIKIIAGTSPNLLAFVIVTHAPVAVSDVAGRWSLPEMLPGQFDVRLWHPRVGLIKQTRTRNRRLMCDRATPEKRILNVGLATRSIGECLLEIEENVPLQLSSPEPSTTDNMP